MADIDWNTILTAVVTSGSLTASIGFFIKQSFEKKLDLRFDKLKEENKSIIHESARRKAKLFDDQYQALQDLVAISYEVRNSNRNVMTHIEKSDLEGYLDACKKNSIIVQKFVDTLVQKRSILPHYLFIACHELKTISRDIDASFTSVMKDDALGHEASSDQFKLLWKKYQHYDKLYENFSITTQSYIGIE